ncbi:MAG: hypothetical protein CMH70_09055 [Nitrosomonadaceae bacterium]|nr:hypothetical protein [Nitrosomonadaceae bacterium]
MKNNLVYLSQSSSYKKQLNKLACSKGVELACLGHQIKSSDGYGTSIQICKYLTNLIFIKKAGLPTGS